MKYIAGFLDWKISHGKELSISSATIRSMHISGLCKLDEATSLTPYHDRWTNLKRNKEEGVSLLDLMAPNRKCCFCHHEMEVPQNGWCLKDSSYAQLCSCCSLAFEEGTFCYQYHQHEDGWRKCDDCERLVHCGCIMALHTFEVNDASGVTCKECIKRKNLVVQITAAASSSVPNLQDQFQPEDSCSSTDNCTEEILDPATLEEGLEMSQLPNCGISFLFEKKLTPTDCEMKTGRLLVPKHYAEKFFPLGPEQQRMPFLVEDTKGNAWEFVLRWWLNKNSRKYVFDGARKCVETMGWNAGDMLKFYRRLPDGTLILKLERAHGTVGTTSGSDVPVPGDEDSKP